LLGPRNRNKRPGQSCIAPPGDQLGRRHGRGKESEKIRDSVPSKKMDRIPTGSLKKTEEGGMLGNTQDPVPRNNPKKIVLLTPCVWKSRGKGKGVKPAGKKFRG